MNFSMYSNALRLFDVNRPQTGDHLGCLDGLRIISMTWVVLGHSFSNINGTAAITNTAFEAPLVSNRPSFLTGFFSEFHAILGQ